MRIGELRREDSGDRARIVATVTWEDRDRPTREVFFETSAEHGDRLQCDGDAFVLGAIMPAARWHERDRKSVV